MSDGGVDSIHPLSTEEVYRKCIVKTPLVRAAAPPELTRLVKAVGVDHLSDVNIPQKAIRRLFLVDALDPSQGLLPPTDVNHWIALAHIFHLQLLRIAPDSAEMEEYLNHCMAVLVPSSSPSLIHTVVKFIRDHLRPTAKSFIPRVKDVCGLLTSTEPSIRADAAALVEMFLNHLPPASQEMSLLAESILDNPSAEYEGMLARILRSAASQKPPVLFNVWLRVGRIPQYLSVLLVESELMTEITGMNLLYDAVSIGLNTLKEQMDAGHDFALQLYERKLLPLTQSVKFEPLKRTVFTLKKDSVVCVVIPPAMSSHGLTNAVSASVSSSSKSSMISISSNTSQRVSTAATVERFTPPPPSSSMAASSVSASAGSKRPVEMLTKEVDIGAESMEAAEAKRRKQIAASAVNQYLRTPNPLPPGGSAGHAPSSSRFVPSAGPLERIKSTEDILEDMFSTIFAWDPRSPPQLPRPDSVSGTVDGVTAGIRKFDTAEAYRAHFKRLLTLEIRGMIYQACPSFSQSSIGPSPWTDVSVTGFAPAKRTAFTVTRLPQDAKDNDLLVVRLLSPSQPAAFARVITINKTVHLISKLATQLAVYEPNNRIQISSPRNLNLQTIVRCLDAIHRVISPQVNPLYAHLLDPSQIPVVIRRQKAGRLIMEISDDLKAKIAERHNSSQRNAISRVLRCTDKSIVVVQGPPGTGKTTFITGLLQTLEAAVERNFRILVCTPSNAAVDEIAVRFMKQCPQAVPRMVRIGQKDSMSEHVRSSIFIDALVEGELPQNTLRKKRNLETEITNLKNRLADTALSASAVTMIETALEKENRELAQIEREILRQRPDMLKKVIKDRTIVLSTLSSSAMLADYPDNGYDTLIIDEATQAIEPEALIPITLFKHSLDRIVLVGDIQQLPPTVLDQDAARDGLSISMIERIQTITEHSVRPEDRSFARTLLDTQYRMHPEIADFSNNAFYDSLLKNDASVCGTGYAHPFGALAFLDIRGAEEKGLSISNEVEATYVSELAAAIASEGDYGIGVITPYRDQLRIIRQNLDRIPHLARAVEVNTVDGFQGREKDIIILSAVRANARGEVGFLTDHRRLNVAVTRAKKMLVICGCASTLRRGDEKWRMLVQHCEDRRRLFRMDGAASPEEARNAVAAWVEDRKRERTRR